MPETPKKGPSGESVQADRSAKEDSWEADQEKRGYYYDDSYGYIKFDPELEDPDEPKGADPIDLRG